MNETTIDYFPGQTKLVHHQLFGAHLFPSVYKLMAAPFKIPAIWNELRKTIDFVDLMILGLLCIVLVPFSSVVFDMFELKRRPHLKTKSVKDEDGKFINPFLRSYSHAIAQRLTEATKIAIVVYLFDICLVVLHVLEFEVFGFSIPEDEDPLSLKLARVLYTIWGSILLIRFKRTLLSQAVNKHPDRMGKMNIYDRILDTIIFTAMGLSIMDSLQFEVGPGLGSLFAFGGVGTMIFGLASKDLCTQFVSGLVLTTSEKFTTGDFIRLGDNITGVVTNMSWMYTEIRGSDEIITKIPNASLTDQKVANVSRMKKSQVSQKIRFEYKDAHKMPAVVAAIKEQIETDCQEHLITDGSRPFRVVWFDLAEDHLGVLVDCHFNIPPIGDSYWNNRQKVIIAIATATKKNEVEFHIPKYVKLGAQ